MDHFGLWIGLGLILGVTACAILLARKAIASVKQFREDHHQRFQGHQQP